jgi:hypothetical protein
MIWMSVSDVLFKRGDHSAISLKTSAAVQIVDGFENNGWTFWVMMFASFLCQDEMKGGLRE